MKAIKVIILITLIGIGVVFVISLFRADKKDEVEEAKVKREIENYKVQIDSLNNILREYETTRLEDSILHAEEVIDHRKSIRKIEKRIHEVNFKKFNNRQLDSIVRLYFGSDTILHANRNGKTSH